MVCRTICGRRLTKLCALTSRLQAASPQVQYLRHLVSGSLSHKLQEMVRDIMVRPTLSPVFGRLSILCRHVDTF